VSGADAAAIIDAGCDFVLIGRAGVLHHNFPDRVLCDPTYRSPTLPVTARHLEQEGLGPVFVDYMRGWPGFVADNA
jgi:hypothetical protein